VQRLSPTAPEARARHRSDLLWHVAIFVVVNAFLWIQDIAAGGGVDYAYWTTIPWGIGLLIHVAAYIVGERRFEERRYADFLKEEEQRQLQAH
jgi:hypothetical protein